MTAPPHFGIKRIMNTTHEDTFWRSIVVVEHCWQWLGATNKDGYGKLRRVQAHRWAYENLRGPIQPGLAIDHLCNNKGCVNPWHMEPVTWRENTIRGLRRSPRVRSTQCRRGHDMSGDNAGVTPGGQRWCRACARIRQQSKASGGRK